MCKCHIHRSQRFPTMLVPPNHPLGLRRKLLFTLWKPSWVCSNSSWHRIWAMLHVGSWLDLGICLRSESQPLSCSTSHSLWTVSSSACDSHMESMAPRFGRSWRNQVLVLAMEHSGTIETSLNVPWRNKSNWLRLHKLLPKHMQWPHWSSMIQPLISTIMLHFKSAINWGLANPNENPKFQQLVIHDSYMIPKKNPP